MANCTHRSISEALRKSAVFEEVQSAELYSLSVEDREGLASTLDTFDFVLTVEHGASFGPLATAAVRERMGDKVFSLPTPFFSGTIPDMAYLIYQNNLARSEAVMGDYHSALILAECCAGYSEGEIVSRYLSGRSFERLDVQGIWEDSLNELKAREVSTEIALSPYIEAAAKDGSLADQFLSFNHPTEGLINYVASTFIEKVKGILVSGELLRPDEHNLYDDAFWPMHPAVAERLGMPAISFKKFKRPARMGGDEMDAEDFVRRSVRFFRDGYDPELFNVVTPSYLMNRLDSMLSPHTAKQDVGHNKMSKGFPNIVMTHFGRSGSTVLAELLKQNSRIVWLDEFFSLMKIRSPETYDFDLQTMLAMIGEAEANVHKTSPEILVGYEIKLMNFTQNPSCNLVDYIGALANPTENVHIVLRRRNTLKRICSVYKANQTKVYHARSWKKSYQDKKFSLNFNDLYDFDTAQRGATMVELIQKAQQREEQVLENYRRAGISYLELFYEDDIEENPVKAYQRVTEFLGLEAEPVKVSLIKTGKSLKSDLQNYQELEEALAGSEFEWMLT